LIRRRCVPRHRQALCRRRQSAAAAILDAVRKRQLKPCDTNVRAATEIVRTRCPDCRREGRDDLTNIAWASRCSPATKVASPGRKIGRRWLDEPPTIDFNILNIG
jgi:hypothetical protein